MERITFKTNESDCVYWEWAFEKLHNVWVLDNYAIYARETKRHAFRVATYYDRIDTRNNTIDKNDIVVTRDIEMKLLAEIVRQFEVKK